MIRRLSPFNTGLHWLHWLIVFMSLVVTFAAWFISSNHIKQKALQSFEFQSSQLLALVTERMAHYEDALRAGVALAHSHGESVSLKEWRRFAHNLKLEDKYPGINGIGVIYHVTPESVNKFIERQNKQRDSFSFHPKHNAGEFWPITFIEPEQSNVQAVGLDIAFENNRLSAAKKARDTLSTQITAPIILVQDAKKTPGFLQYVPIYSSDELDTLEQRQKSFIGHVYAPFIMRNLIKGTLNKDKRQLIFSIFDGNTLLYDEISKAPKKYIPSHRVEKNIEMYGRPWRFVIQSAPVFTAGVSSYQPSFILVGGIVIDCLLLLLFTSLSRSNRAALLETERVTNKMEASEEYFRHIIDFAPCGIVVVGQSGRIENVNRNCNLLFGYEEEELLGKSIECLIPARFSDKHPKLRASFYEGEAQNRRMGFGREVYGLRKSGLEFPAEIGLAQFNGGGGVKTLATVIDMTEHYHVMEEFKRSNKALNDFAYVASHDLKAPLRGIHQLAGWIEDSVAGHITEDTKEYFSLLYNRVNRLEALLNDLLAFSRVGKKHGDFKQVELSRWLADIFSLLAPPQGFSISCDVDVQEINTLVVPLELILRNLIGNAIKHHDKPSGCITISCEEVVGGYQFSIFDDGPGIAEGHQDKVFEMFQTLKPRDQVEGSGMGLAIVKRVLEIYHSDIRLFSNGVDGSCFVFIWPDEKQLKRITGVE